MAITHPPILQKMIQERYAPGDETPEQFKVRAPMRGFFAYLLVQELFEQREISPAEFTDIERRAEL